MLSAAYTVPGVRRTSILLAAIGLLAGVPAPSSAAPALRGEVIGTSGRGAAIRAVAIGPDAAPRKVLVVGCVHGNECAGGAVTRRLRRLEPPPGVQVWVIDRLNPDGAAAGTRQNARGVDLNRNFPYRWRALGAPGSTFYSGPRAGSEPETRAARTLILRIRPAVSIWFHQHMHVVVRAPGDVALQRHYGRLTGLGLRDLPPYPGTAVSWEHHVLPETTSFVVELARGAMSARAVAAHARAVLSVARG
jgi:murein peptide amidase A